jgi:catechol 2,3-dioxygenase
MTAPDLQTSAPAAASPRLPDDLGLGPTHLVVCNLDRASTWYQDALGLQEHGRDDGVARLGAGEDDVLVLHEQPGAREPGRHAGLYHVALLYPSRLELARAGQRLAASRTPVDGASDHGTHEAFYLRDADGNGLELAADRPREQWPDVRSISGYAGGPQPLDVADLLSLVEGAPVEPQAAPGLRTGHLHLHVGDIDRARAFYRDILGFEEMVNLGSAAFLSAGGYHHHVGFNVWRGQGIGPYPPGTLGLDHWTIQLASDDVAAVRARIEAAGIATEPVDGGFVVRDPWNIPVAIVSR